MNQILLIFFNGIFKKCLLIVQFKLWENYQNFRKKINIPKIFKEILAISKVVEMNLRLIFV